jgi:hypothetical protein
MKNKFIKSLIFFSIFVLTNKIFSSEAEQSLQNWYYKIVTKFKETFQAAMANHNKTNQSLVDSLNSKHLENLNQSTNSFNLLIESKKINNYNYTGEDENEKKNKLNLLILDLVQASIHFIKKENFQICSMISKNLEFMQQMKNFEENLKKELDQIEKSLNQIKTSSERLATNSVNSSNNFPSTLLLSSIKNLNDFRGKELQNQFQISHEPFTKESIYSIYLNMPAEERIKSLLKQYINNVVIKQKDFQTDIQKPLEAFEEKDINSSVRDIIPFTFQQCSNLKKINIPPVEIIKIVLNEIKNAKIQNSDTNKQNPNKEEKSNNSISNNLNSSNNNIPNPKL